MEFPETNTFTAIVEDIDLPRFVRVQYEPEMPELDDMDETVRTELDALPFSELDEGSSVAVGVGSRGIDRIGLVAEIVVDELGERGFDPVVVPAMGSHGGATAEGPLLDRAYAYMPTLPYDDLDVLVVDRIGKDISGTGMDTNVIGRYQVLNTSDPDTPDISRIYVRSLTEATHGNGAGIGLADITRRELVENLDLEQVYTNALTSSSLQKAHIPVVMPNDELAIREALTSVGTYNPEEARVTWIRDTGHLSKFRISEALVGEASGDITVEGWDRLSFKDGETVFTPEADQG